jgi:biotin transport system permease protein
MLHRLDSRAKTVALFAVSVSLMAADFSGLAFSALFLVLGLRQAALPLRQTVTQMRYFLILLIVVFFTRALVTPGEVLFKTVFLTITRQGLIDGALVCTRLLAIIVCGLIYSATTKPKQVRMAVAALLKPLPGQAAAKAATLMALMVRFVPEVLYQMRRTQTALSARGIENRRNPLRRLRYFSIPVLRNTILTADCLALALAARCFDAASVPVAEPIVGKDWLFLLLVAAGCLLVFVIPFTQVAA